MTSVTIQHFHEDVEAVEQASASGPVFITTEDGNPKCVLIDIGFYRRLCHTKFLAEQERSGKPQEKPAIGMSTLADICAVPEAEYFDWEPERLYVTFRPLDLD